jgi:hypothetical protein
VRLARPQPIHLYSGLVFLTGAAVIAALVISPSPVRISHAPVQFWIFAAVVMLGELLPVSIPRQDDDIQITVSTTFAFAILLAYGTTPAVLVFAAASVIGDMATRLAWYKVLLNLGQYALAMAACGLLLDATIGLGGGLSQFPPSSSCGSRSRGACSSWSTWRRWPPSSCCVTTPSSRP